MRVPTLLFALLASMASAQRLSFNSEWTLYRYGQAGQETTVVSFTPPVLRFDVGRIVGETGCNSFSAGFLTRGREVKVGTINATRAACPTPGMKALEEYFINSLAQAKRFQVSGDFLVLFTSDRETLVFRRTQ